VAEPTDVRSDLRALLDAVEAAPPVDAVDVLARELARMVNAVDVSFLIADFSGDAALRFMPEPTGSALTGQYDRDHMATVPLAGSPYGRALRSQAVCVEDHGGTTRLYAPVTDRGDALGVLELALPSAPDEDMVTFIASAAHALAYVIIANRRHTDLFERGQRNTPFSLAAEIQRRLLPPAFTCEGAEFTVAGWLEPASEAGGDTFDYSVERSRLHVSISDAKGHTVNAAQLATLAVSSLRNSRRSEASVVDQASAANTTITGHATEEDYVAAIVMSVDLVTGVVEVVNAGHPTPHLVRDGVATALDLHADLPFGMFAEAEYRAQALVLKPGDRLVLATDGMLERNASALDIAVALTEMVDLHPREVVHTFARAVLAATGGNLEDDATVLCLDWYGPQGSGGGRVTSAGATQSRASAPPSADGQ
jgi:serine phosphatase RsbU (regulator of sigma subunit)